MPNDDLALLDAAVPESAAEPEAAPAPDAEVNTTASEPAAPEAPAPVEVDYPDDDLADAPEAPAAAAPPAQTEPQPAPPAARFGPAALSRLLQDNAELAAAAEANPRVKAQLYQMARRSQELAAYQDALPSLGQAREALAARETLEHYDQTYFGSQPEGFWRGLYEASGQTGAYERNVQYLQQAFMAGLEQRATEGKNRILGDAVAAIRENLGWKSSRGASTSQASGGSAPLSASDGDGLPPHIRQQLEELEQLRSRRSEEERQALESFLDETGEEAGREIRAFVGGILGNAHLSDYEKESITRDFLEAVARAADEDKVHNAALSDILQQGGLVPATRARMAAQAKAWVRQNGRDILEPILKRAGAGLRQRQQQRQAAAASARREPAAAGAPSAPRSPSGHDLVRQAEQRLGRRLTDREILELA